MDYQEQIKLARDIVVQLRYLESMDNIIYYDRWNACPKDAFEYEGKVGACLSGIRHEKLVSPRTKELAETFRHTGTYASDLDKGVADYLV